MGSGEWSNASICQSIRSETGEGLVVTTLECTQFANERLQHWTWLHRSNWAPKLGASFPNHPNLCVMWKRKPTDSKPPSNKLQILYYVRRKLLGLASPTSQTHVLGFKTRWTDPMINQSINDEKIGTLLNGTVRTKPIESKRPTFRHQTLTVDFLFVFIRVINGSNSKHWEFDLIPNVSLLVLYPWKNNFHKINWDNRVSVVSKDII